jgi:ABC-type Fe3+/spermidine/putrescine transport system ATPase subunit
MLEVKNISLGYESKNVVQNISFNLKKGERIVILGPSGCGKTTLLKSIGGFHNIVKGNIKFNELNVKTPADQLVPGHDLIKLVNQDFSLDEYHTVEENIRLKLLQFDADYITQRIEELLKLTALDRFRNRRAENLSGGQKQRLAIARALADEPELLLLDEPFNQLDYHLRQKIEGYIIKYVEKYNISIILVTHSGEEAMRWADNVIFMKNGKLVRLDSTVNFYNQPSNKFEGAFFGLLNTIILNKKEVSFRPNNYKLSKSDEYYLSLSLEFVSSVFKGWYFENNFKFGNRVIRLYSDADISSLKEVWVKPIDFKSKK